MNTIKQLSTLTSRIVKQNLTSPDTIITTVLTPIFMLLFFVYVMGDSILVHGVSTGRSAYLAYALPGFLLMAMAMGSAYTALRINNDKVKGFMTRLLSMPIKRWVILGAHILASTIFMLISVITVLITGIILGYRPQASLPDLGLFLLLIIVFAIVITVVAIPFSLTAKDFNGAGSFSYLLIFLLFISPAFIPVAGMAKPIRFFAENQPMTPIVATTKALLNGSFTFSANSTLLSIGWLLGLLLMFSYFSFKRYQQVFVNI
ncbi:ABC transporter permease [Pediococcus stilesii]|uniref:Transport permease protein n=1 Tax=Pediococcus stilesii TaxID=331679 RepID=A0A5R9BXS9_9LACO|nr:ABC transporter permease [Pediococcus stilesii]TLQ05083.1 ABC transporter permease [Pediococcus stilesii]